MKENAQANLENLYRIFTVNEGRESTLGSIDQAISENVAGFLQEHIVALERQLKEIEVDFAFSKIPENPTFVSEYTEFVKKKLVAQSVHTASPGFVGHMTSAMPYFMLPLSRIMIALNQNLVKVETSKAFTPMERQVLAMLSVGFTIAKVPWVLFARVEPSRISPRCGPRAIACVGQTAILKG